MDKIKNKYNSGVVLIEDNENGVDNFSRIVGVLKDLGPSPKTKQQGRKTKGIPRSLRNANICA